MTFWIIQTLNGLSFSMMLFLIAAGFTLIFGLMKIINIAHGSFYLLSAYIGLTIIQKTGNFLLAVVISSMSAVVVGVAMQSLFLRRFLTKELQKVLLAFGFVLIIADLCLWVWGGAPLALPKPSLFKGSIWIGSVVFPSYRLFVILIGVIIAVGLWIFQEKTKFGAVVLAGVDDEEMLRGSGINIQLVFTGVFGLGVSLCTSRPHPFSIIISMLTSSFSFFDVINDFPQKQSLTHSHLLFSSYFLSTHRLRRFHHRVNDLLVPGAAAEIA